MSYAHIEHESIRRALEQDGFDSDSHADECIRITRDAFYTDATNPEIDNPARETALDDMVQSEIIGESAINGLKEFWL